MTRTTAEEFLERHSQARLSLGDHMGANGKHEILGSRQWRFWASGWYAQSQIYRNMQRRRTQHIYAKECE